MTKALQACQIRLVCNAAGDLLPSLAFKLRVTIKCVILTSYGITDPPLGYRLDHQGTCGIRTGPDLTILDWSGTVASCGTLGRVCVRGAAVFAGYLKADNTYDWTCFNEDGWFDTGDLGFLNEDDYLFITGRSKEVVYDILQKVVALALVTAINVPRVDLKTLHDTLKSSPSAGQMVGINNVHGRPFKKEQKSSSHPARHREATCPSHDTAISAPIDGVVSPADLEMPSAELRTLLPAEIDVFWYKRLKDGAPEPFLCHGYVNIDNTPDFVDDLRYKLGFEVHNYLIPRGLGIPSEAKVTKIFYDILLCSPIHVPRDVSFFDLGRVSLRAGRLMSKLRVEFGIHIPVNTIFNEETAMSLATHIKSLSKSKDDKS
ncbi:unnamed protein product [Fusarium equiseti]|uniref:Carrier domain-containing protein n=1 Tax=Fusarium equiseti TaxID=61235 RepID=A0A8J2JDM2_FUSEQ|nr:unnamed protein product [Fusarium equiseti]